MDLYEKQINLALPSVKDDQNPVPYLGHGFSSLTGATSPPRVVDPINNQYENLEGEVRWEIGIIEDLETLRQTLGLDASGSLYSSSAQLSIFNSSQKDKYHLFASINLKIRVKVGRLKVAKALPEAASVFAHGSDREIFEKYGDRFVVEVVEGGQLFFLLNYSTSSDEEYTSLKASLSVSGGAGSGEVGLLATTSTLKKHRQVDTKGWLNGTLIDLPKGEEWKAIETFVSSFPSKIKAEPALVILELHTAPLNQVETGWPLHRKPFTLDAAQARLKSLTDVKVAEIQLRNDWMYIKEHPFQFGRDPRARDAAQNIDDLKGIEKGIDDEAHHILINPVGFKPEQQKEYITKKYTDLPARMTRFAPRVIAPWRAIIRDEDENPIQDAVTEYVVDPSNPDRNWIHARSGSHANIRWLTISFERNLPGVDMRYKARFQGGNETKLLVAGEQMRVGDLLMTGIMFDFVGEMADAYWIEYQIHAMNTGDGETCGNTANCQRKLGEFADKEGREIEGIRLQIWPK